MLSSGITVVLSVPGEDEVEGDVSGAAGERISIACSEALCAICMRLEAVCSIFPGDDGGDVDTEVVTAGGVGDEGVFTAFA